MQSDNIQSAAPPAEPVRTHQDVLHLIADVERQVARLRDVQALSVDELNRQESRLRELESREHSIQAAEEALVAREAHAASLAEALRHQDMQTAARVRELEQREQSCLERADQIERERALLESDRARVTEEARRLQREVEEIAALRDELARREEALAIEAVRHRELVDALRTQLEAAELARVDAATQTSEAQAALAELEKRCAGVEAQLVTLETEKRDLVNELRRAQESEAAHVAVIEARLAERNTELDATRQSLQLAGQKLAALAQSVADQTPQLERGAAALALVQDQERRIRELQQRLEANAAHADRAALLESNLEVAQRKNDVLAATVTSLERDVLSLREAVETAESNARALDAKLTEVTSVRDAAESAAVTSLQKRLEEKSNRMAEVGMLLKLRKERLDRARRLTRERVVKVGRRTREATEAALVQTLEEERLIKRQREELRHVQDMLAASEQRLMRRSARTRGLAAMTWCMLATSGVAVGCWVAADVVWPVPSLATVDFVAKAGDGMNMTPERDTEWQRLHREALQDDAFRAGVERRLAERGVYALGGSSEIAAWMDSVRFDADGPGTFRLVAPGPDPESTIIALDTLATSLANDSAKLVKARDLPRAALAGNTAQPGRVQFSTLVPQSTLKDRLAAAGMLFAAVAGLGLAAGLVVFGRLSRAKRKFDESGAV